ncbi:MAG: LytR C-terminal domain-containing protein [Actinomycetota bacterium]|nr:LytR C-terminal domain-containing protein [Actinomycetota bacterium]
MSKHLEDGDRSFVASVVRHLLAGVALVATVAAAFWGVGRLQTTPTEVEVGTGTTQEPTVETPAVTATEDAPTIEDTAAVQDPPTATSPTATSPTVTPTDPATSTVPAVDPSQVTVQVLDATSDGGGRAAHAARTLREAGYRVVAVNRAVRSYARTTVFYTADQTVEAQAVAAALPSEDEVIEAKPDSLSDSVKVHVVVGTDYPKP